MDNLHVSPIMPIIQTFKKEIYIDGQPNKTEYVVQEMQEDGITQNWSVSFDREEAEKVCVGLSRILGNDNN